MKKFLKIFIPIFIIFILLPATVVLPSLGVVTSMTFYTPDDQKVTLKFHRITKVDFNNFEKQFHTRRSIDKINENLANNGFEKFIDFGDNKYLYTFNDKYLYYFEFKTKKSKNYVYFKTSSIVYLNSENDFLNFPSKDCITFWTFPSESNKMIL